MVYSVLTGLALFLLSGKLWAGVLGLFIGAAATRFFRRRVVAFINKKGGVSDVKVLKQVCHDCQDERAMPEDREYTVLVRYGNGEKYKYTMRGDTALFSQLRPYITN
ncbi:MAG: hypothetical protein IJB76_05190 [Clostridia bacterium]|nr:hypothetical protein [Clostridia bacterium]